MTDTDTDTNDISTADLEHELDSAIRSRLIDLVVACPDLPPSDVLAVLERVTDLRRALERRRPRDTGEWVSRLLETDEGKALAAFCARRLRTTLEWLLAGGETPPSDQS